MYSGTLNFEKVEFIITTRPRKMESFLFSFTPLFSSHFYFLPLKCTPELPELSDDN